MHGPLDKAAIIRGGNRLRYGTAAAGAGADDEHNAPTPESRSLAATAATTSRNTTASSPPRNPPLPEELELVVAQGAEGEAAGSWTDGSVLQLKSGHKQKVDSLMRSIHKLQEQVKQLRRADKENRRSKLIISLQQTVGEQEVAIRGMIRALAGFGYKDEQFREIFKGKKTLRDVDAVETGLRTAERERDKAQRKLEVVSSKLGRVEGTREQIETQYEGQIREWQSKAASAEAMGLELDEARTEVAAVRARAEAMASQMEEVMVARQELHVEAKEQKIILGTTLPSPRSNSSRDPHIALRANALVTSVQRTRRKPWLITSARSSKMRTDWRSACRRSDR